MKHLYLKRSKDQFQSEFRKSFRQAKTKLKLKDKAVSNAFQTLPNLPMKDVPIGKDENDNVEISKKR